jgi:glycosyltransferase involved in cell wall biosynthesis
MIDLPVRLVGPADRSWLEVFDPGHCKVQPAIELAAVDAEIRAAGLALVTLADRSGNHQIALPNKLFHAVRVGVPVVASDVGELGATVRAHGLGVVYRSGDAASLAAALKEALLRYPELVAAVRRSAEHLSWDRDRNALLQVYDELSR